SRHRGFERNWTRDRPGVSTVRGERDALFAQARTPGIGCGGNGWHIRHPGRQRGRSAAGGSVRGEDHRAIRSSRHPRQQCGHQANELGPGVRVNLIAAGLIKTDFSRATWESAAGEEGYPWPLRRIGRPEDVANAALFLAGSLSDWITGQVLVVDGGALGARSAT